MPLRAYRLAMQALSPVASLILRSRARRGKEAAERLAERWGRSSLPRPQGTLLWVHGASVGECLSVLPLIDLLLKQKERHVLATSGTVTSARLMQERLPPGAFHQFVPLDTPAAVARFLDHWKPDGALFVDSELWPNLMLGAARRSIPLAIINARMSEKSFSGWRRAPKTAAALLAPVAFILAQDTFSAERFERLGATSVSISGNLKADVPALPANPAALAALQSEIGARPVLLAASTHEGEDRILIEVQDALRASLPDLLTIIVPRHPERGNAIAQICGARTWRLRSSGNPVGNAAIYIADTIGELGLFYRLAPFAFIGGSLVPHGGQNPLEAAKLGAAVLAGPHTQNFDTEFATIFAAQGDGRVKDARQLSEMALRLFENPQVLSRMRAAAGDAAASLGGALLATHAAVESLLAAHART